MENLSPQTKNVNAPKITKKFKIIRNGNRLAPKTHMNTFYNYAETSRFDSLMEIIVRACDDNIRFEKFCLENMDKNQTDFLKAVINYCKEVNLRNLYNYRFDILFHKNVESLNEKNLIFSKDTIGSYCNKIMKLQSFCKKCKKTIEFDNFTIEASNISKQQLFDIKNYLPSSTKICNSCGEVIKYNSHFIAIDVEKQCMKCQIFDVPLSIFIQSTVFDLVGIVGTPLKGDANTHYIAYSFSSTNYVWTECDDLKTKNKELNCRKKFDIYLALIIYLPRD